MSTRYRRTNPLALAVLALLWERGMHPYEMASTLRDRRKEGSVKLNYGSLYTVVESLERHGFIVAVESRREGRRPERTVYGLTEHGSHELHEWLRDLIGVPVNDYPQFEAGMSLVGVLAPDEVSVLLEQRRTLLDQEIANLRDITVALRARGLPPLAVIEWEYRLAMLEAEHTWVGKVTSAMRDNTLDGIQQWRDRQAHRVASSPFADLAGQGKTT
jgi:DNA-binding PadR family transcriptional regulator